MQMVVPSFLEQSLKSFAVEQERMREQLTAAFGKTPMGMIGIEPMKAMEATVRRNTEMFQKAMKMFIPFTPAGAAAPLAAAETAKPAAGETGKDDLSDLKEQIAAMQRKLETISKG